MTGPSADRYDFDRQWPIIPVDREAVRIFNRRGRVAVVFGQLRVGETADAPLAKVLEAMPADFPLGVLAAVGRVRTLKEGLERLVRNVIANPHIDTLILVGRDSKVFRPLRGLDCLLRHGVDADGHILAPDQDEQVRRVFARDSLVNLTAKEIDYFRRSGVRVVADLIDGPADAAEALSAAARIARDGPVRTSPPSWAFLEELDLSSWRAGRTVEAGEPYPPPAPHRLDFRLDGDAEAVYLNVAFGGSQLRARIGRSVSLASEKLLHTWLRWIRPLGTPADFEVAEAAMRLEEAMLPRPEESSSPSLAARRAGEEYVDATLTPFDDDPKGYFVTRVDYERGQILTDVFQNARPGDASSAKQVCTVVGPDPHAVLRTLLEGDWFGRHTQRLEHIGYVALMLKRAEYCVRTGYGFTQDKPVDFGTRRNVDWELNGAVLINVPTLSDAWRKSLWELHNNGLLTTTQKGRVAENWCTLIHIAKMGELAIPQGYPTSESNIAAYAEDFVARKPEGADQEYTYGDRMCHHYGYDQLRHAVMRLTTRPKMAQPTQRYDPWTDLGRSHIPCLAFDVWFLGAGGLHTLQIARAHDIFGAMPQNALGISRGWARRIGRELGVELGDLVFLSVSNNYRIADNGESVIELVEGDASFASKLSFEGIDRFLEHRGYGVRPADFGTLGRTYLEHWPHAEEMQSHNRGIDSNRERLRLGWWPEQPSDVTGRLEDHPLLHYRLRRHRGLDQIARFAEHLNSALAKNPYYRTQYGVLSPRDPWLDREAEATDLLSLQLRNQLGKLHAAAVFVNSESDLRTQLSIVTAIQREAARLVNHPPGSVFILNVMPRYNPAVPADDKTDENRSPQR